MENFTLPVQIRWSDIDANRHLRHSAYYDFGAYSRMILLTRFGLTNAKFEELAVGPILFREEAVFRKEIVFEDKIFITAEILKANADFSRWTIRHQIIKEDQKVAAIITVDGAWIDLKKRKLAVPGEFIQKVFEQLPKAMEFEAV